MKVNYSVPQPARREYSDLCTGRELVPDPRRGLLSQECRALPVRDHERLGGTGPPFHSRSATRSPVKSLAQFVHFALRGKEHLAVEEGHPILKYAFKIPNKIT